MQKCVIQTENSYGYGQEVMVVVKKTIVSTS